MPESNCVTLATLPNEVLYTIFKVGGLGVLTSGFAWANRRLHRISCDQSLWLTALQNIFEQSDLSTAEVESIQDYRAWFREYYRRNRDIYDKLDAILEGAEPEKCLSAIMHYGRLARPALMFQRKRTANLMERYWASWLLSNLAKFEGFGRLAVLSAQMSPDSRFRVPNLGELLKAMLLVKSSASIRRLFDLLDCEHWERPGGRAGPLQQLGLLIREVLERLSGHLTMELYLNGVIFNYVLARAARIVGWRAEILFFSCFSYCAVWIGKEVVFVDFARECSLRTLQDMVDRIGYTHTEPSTIRYGISPSELVNFTIGSLAELIRSADNAPPRFFHQATFSKLVIPLFDGVWDQGDVQSLLQASRTEKQLLYSQAEVLPNRAVATGCVCRLAARDENFFVVVLQAKKSSSLVSLNCGMYIVPNGALTPVSSGVPVNDGGLMRPAEPYHLELGEVFTGFDVASWRYVANFLQKPRIRAWRDEFCTEF